MTHSGWLLGCSHPFGERAGSPILNHIWPSGIALCLPQWTLTILIFLVFIILSQLSCCEPSTFPAMRSLVCTWTLREVYGYRLHSVAKDSYLDIVAIQRTCMNMGAMRDATACVEFVAPGMCAVRPADVNRFDKTMKPNAPTGVGGKAGAGGKQAPPGAPGRHDGKKAHPDSAKRAAKK